MEADEQITLLTLFDSYWFVYGVFAKKPPLSEQNPILEIHEKIEEEPKLSRILTTRHVRSLSDDLMSFKDMSCGSSEYSLSPNSVLAVPKLETILSGKEVGGFPENRTAKQEIPAEKEKPAVMERRGRGRGRRRGRSSRSLSELEFEEVKGFMDLGFVFSEEDMNSSLVSLIPGLQRLGKGETQIRAKEEEEEEEKEKGIDGISRRYLSEAWDAMEEEEEEEEKKKKKIENFPLMNWKIPSLGGNNEIDIKDHLKFWAHSVASTVR